MGGGRSHSVNDKLGRGVEYYGNRIKGIVTYAYICALSRFGCTVFHGSPPFTAPCRHLVLRGKYHKRCYLCRGIVVGIGRPASSLRLADLKHWRGGGVVQPLFQMVIDRHFLAGVEVRRR